MLDVPIENSGIRKIAHETRTTHPVSGGITQKPLIWLLSVTMSWSDIGGRLWKGVCRIRSMQSIGAAELNTKSQCTGSVLKCGV